MDPTDFFGSSFINEFRGRRRYVSRLNYYGMNNGVRVTPKPLPQPQPLPRPNDEFKTKEEEEVLKVLELDLMIAENSSAHRTERYELTRPVESWDDERLLTGGPRLVVRRGQPFDVRIKFDRPFNNDKDDLKLIFDFVVADKPPSESGGTRVVLILSDEDEPKKWGAKILSQKETTFTIRIFTPPQLQVGKWKFCFDAILKMNDKEKPFRFTYDKPIYVLFNPWCPDDQVFMEDETHRSEYVLNDQGELYAGSSSSINRVPWYFGQFEDFVLELSILLLDASQISSKFNVRGNPVPIVRTISALVNSNDDNGVLEGRWDGEYFDGTSPSAWNGSVAILEQYWRTRQSVKYGQCWVFSAIVTTICRSLGIPCRSVTNFSSAHDTDGSLTIDSHYDHKGKPLEAYNSDSIWNFHVWNEVWMQRPDLPAGFGGWQAIDATPQETSEGVYCAGPASVEALKKGLVDLPYDAPFIFAEVNADRVYCIHTKQGNEEYVTEADTIGKHISTKMPGNSDRMDITDQYKSMEGSEEERAIVWKALSLNPRTRKERSNTIQEMDFKLEQKEFVMIGQSFDVVLRMTNRCDETRTVKTTIRATAAHYNGVSATDIKSKRIKTTIEPKKEAEIRMTVDVIDYLDKIPDMGLIKMSALSQVVETKLFHADADDFQLRKPALEIKAPREVKLGETYDIEVSFVNPLDLTLTRCRFNFESSSIRIPVTKDYEDVPPKGEVKCTCTLKALKLGEKDVIVGFWSRGLSGLTGTVKVKINAE